MKKDKEEPIPAEEEIKEESLPLEDAAEEKISAREKVMIALNDDDDEKLPLSVGAILGGDIFSFDWFKRQLVFLLMIVAMTVCYVTNRYKSQSNLIKIEKMKKELTDKRYEAVTCSSQLVEKTRKSKIADRLKTTRDSTLAPADRQPFKIKVGYIETVK